MVKMDDGQNENRQELEWEWMTVRMDGGVRMDDGVIMDDGVRIDKQKIWESFDAELQTCEEISYHGQTERKSITISFHNPYLSQW